MDRYIKIDPFLYANDRQLQVIIFLAGKRDRDTRKRYRAEVSRAGDQDWGHASLDKEANGGQWADWLAAYLWDWRIRAEWLRDEDTGTRFTFELDQGSGIQRGMTRERI